jgi:thiol-disulfide isomerase/thioredoxin
MVSRVAMVCLLGIALGAVSACDRQTPGNGQAAAVSDEVVAGDEVAPGNGAARIAGAVDRSHKGEAGPAVTFEGLDGAKTTLAALKGKPVLLNLWATWCAPCVKEMPTLDAAAGTLGDKVQVIAVSQDMEPAKARDFLKQRGFTHLRPYLDPALGLSLAYGANLPTTILYGADGKEIWRVPGELDWTGAKAKALLAEAG